MKSKIYYKMKVYVAVAVICLVSLATNSSGQDVNEPYKFSFVPPSPIAASLGQYGEIPVSYYTGTPSIDIPIWEVKGRDLSVPISLSYHASGIKVDQRDGMMGLGWALNAGGVITRTIMGKNDEYGGGVGYRSIHSSLMQYLNNTMSTSNAYTFENNCAAGMYDTEPDEYYYNFVGKSGKLVFDQNGAPNFIPNVKYAISGNISSGFTVTIEDGTKYIFNEIGHSSVQPPTGETIGGNTSWFLTKIVSTTGDYIDFTYARSTESYDLTMSETRKVLLLSDGEGCNNDLITREQNTYFGDKIEISEISSVNTLVKITKDKIQIFDKANITVPVKEFVFQYGFFGPGSQRLKLLSMQEISGTSVKPPYAFEYYDIAPPSYNSLQQDHWGFFNQNTEPTLVPSAILGTDYFDGANRDPESTLMKMCLLKEIKYPTGGKTVFDFEAHDYSHIGGTLVVKDVFEGEEVYLESDGITTLTSGPIDIEVKQLVSLHISMNSEIIEQDAAGTVYLDQNHSYALQTDGPSNQIIEFVLTPGTYYLNLESFWNNNDVSINATLFYKDKIGETNISSAGGVRIKRILNYDGISSEPVRIKKFEYKNDLLSSGVLGSEPNYLNYSYSYEYADFAWQRKACNYFVRTSTNRALLGLTHGSHVGYQYVTEYNDENGQNGKSIYQYTSAFETPDYVANNPPAVTSFDYKRGLLKSKSDFKYKNGVYSKVYEVKNEYTFREDVLFNEIVGFKASYRSLDHYGTNQSEFFNSIYYNKSQWVYQFKKEEIFYYDGSPSVNKTTDFIYLNPAHMQMTSALTTQSDGKVSKSEYKYAADLSNTDLLSRNMQSQILETKSYVDNNLILIETVGYDEINGMMVPVLNEIYPTGGSDKSVLTYTYDAYGNIIQAVKDSHFPVSFIYGYNNSLPIVKGVNVSYSELLAAYNAAVGTSNFDLNLRNHPNAVNALITTYTYNPLYGLITQRDANGLSVHYEYDALGRLTITRDHDGNILKNVKYHYQTQEP